MTSFANAKHISDREFSKFVADAAGAVAVRVKFGSGGQSFTFSVTAGITAGTTQTQAGATALTTMINEVSTVGTANDGVKLKTAVAGDMQVVINNGANNLKIWPASGDNLGAGVDTGIVIGPGANITFMAYDTTNWETV